MDTKQTHTTWVVRGTAGHEKHGQSGVYDENDTSGHDIAIVYDGDAHGDLIAAAPALLAALIQCHDAILAMQIRLGDTLQYEDVRLQARAAIAQAEKD